MKLLVVFWSAYIIFILAKIFPKAWKPKYYISQDIQKCEEGKFYIKTSLWSRDDTTTYDGIIYEAYTDDCIPEDSLIKYKDSLYQWAVNEIKCDTAGKPYTDRHQVMTMKPFWNDYVDSSMRQTFTAVDSSWWTVDSIISKWPPRNKVTFWKQIYKPVPYYPFTFFKYKKTLLRKEQIK